MNPPRAAPDRTPDNIPQLIQENRNRIITLRENLTNLQNQPDTQSNRTRIRNIIELLNRSIKIVNSLERRLNPPRDRASEATPAQEGDGFIQRNPRLNPPAVRKLLEKIGGETINTIKIVRTPLSFATRTLLNIASFGQLDKVMKQIGVDKFFHLSLLINGKYVYEKNAVINLTEDPNIVKKNSETLDVDVNRGLTIDEFVKNTQLQMADNYGPYDAKTNNCSVFVNAALKANWLSNANTVDFLSQKTDKLFDGFPSLTKNIVDFATSLGSSVDRQVQGEGYRQGGLTPEDVKGLIYDSRNIIRTGDYIVGGGDMMYNYAYPRCKVKF